MAACLPIGGRLGDVYGYRRVYLLGTLLFLGGCGLSALDLGFLPTDFGRSLQGDGSPSVTPSILAIIARPYVSSACSTGTRRRALPTRSAQMESRLARTPSCSPQPVMTVRFGFGQSSRAT
jgi:MFS family permease